MSFAFIPQQGALSHLGKRSSDEDLSSATNSSSDWENIRCNKAVRTNNYQYQHEGYQAALSQLPPSNVNGAGGIWGGPSSNPFIPAPLNQSQPFSQFHQSSTAPQFSSFTTPAPPTSFAHHRSQQSQPQPPHPQQLPQGYVPQLGTTHNSHQYQPVLTQQQVQCASYPPHMVQRAVTHPPQPQYGIHAAVPSTATTTSAVTGSPFFDTTSSATSQQYRVAVAAAAPCHGCAQPIFNSSLAAAGQCFFCEKMYCTASCIATCDSCRQQFCKNCRTVSYECEFDRVVCLECNGNFRC